MCEKSEDALICAAWMEKEGIEELLNVGPFMAVTFAKNQKARIKKGSVIFTTAPAASPQGAVNLRNQVVTVFLLSKNRVDHYHREGVIQGKVEWIGSRGYYRWTEINNVSAIE